jgi:hypothetical protein
MAEGNNKSAEELKRELESEKEKIKRLEELIDKEEKELAKKEGLLNELYQRMMIEGVMSREDIAKAIGKEQYEALSYHLAKEHQKRLEAEKKLFEDEEKLKAEDSKLSLDEEELKKDEKKISELEEDLNKEKKSRMELEVELFKGYPKHEMGSGSDEILEDLDLGDLELTAGEKAVSKRSGKVHASIKDLILLLLRINRMKTIDASIMLNTSKENVINLAKALERNGYIEIENPKSSDPTLRALRRLIELKGR